MKFELDEAEDTSRKWYNDRYAVVIQKTTGKSADTYVVYVCVNDESDGNYDVIYPRFEGHGLSNMAPVAERIVRDMGTLKQDAAMSKVEKVLKDIKECLLTAYAAYKNNKNVGLLKDFGIDPKKDKPGNSYIDYHAE